MGKCHLGMKYMTI